MFKILLVASGGAIGAVLRYLTTVVTMRVFGKSKVLTGTVAANTFGCFLAGVGYGWVLVYSDTSPEWILFLSVGVLGSYTTFSTFALEAYHLLKNRYQDLILYLLLQIVVVFAAVLLGLGTIKLFTGG